MYEKLAKAVTKKKRDTENALPPVSEMVRDHRHTLAGVTAATLGRLQALPIEAVVSPTRFVKNLGTPDLKASRQVYEEMRAKHPEALKNTVVQVGGHDILENFKRTWNNEALPPGQRHIAALAAPYVALNAAQSRGDHYYPLNDTVTLYSPSPDILRHELGHAVDFNNKRLALEALGEKMKPWAGLGPLAYNFAANHIPGGTLWAEAQATRHALNAVKDDPEREAEAWRQLAPAYGTYAGGAAYALHRLAVSKGLLPNPPDNSLVNKTLLGLPMYTIGGVLAGHGVAALRNALARRRRERQAADAATSAA